jgi:hypothetical protein
MSEQNLYKFRKSGRMEETRSVNRFQNFDCLTFRKIM